MKYLKRFLESKHKLFYDNIISECHLILMELEDNGLRVDINYTSDFDLHIFITNKSEENEVIDAFPKIQKFDYSDIKYNIEHLLSFLSEDFSIQSIYSILDWIPNKLDISDLNSLQKFQRLEFRFNKKNQIENETY